MTENGSETTKPANRPSTTGERLNWLRELVSKTPQMNVQTARMAVLAHFGTGLGTTAVSNILREARVQAGLQPPRRGRPVESESNHRRRIAELVEVLRRFGVTKIEILPDSYRVLMWTSEESLTAR